MVLIQSSVEQRQLLKLSIIIYIWKNNIIDEKDASFIDGINEKILDIGGFLSIQVDALLYS